MYQPMLFVHWKQARLALLPFSVAAFGLPLVSVQGLGGVRAEAEFGYAFASWATASLPVYPLLAFLTGVVLALTAWNWDHQLKHVYALSLPLARWEYAMLKMGAGAVLMLIPTVLLWLGAQIAAAAVTLPEGLHAYPNQLAFRFFLAILLSYSLLFAMAAGTVKTSVRLLSTIIAVLIGSVVVFGALGFADAAMQYLWRAGGPLEVFTGSWALIDV